MRAYFDMWERAFDFKGRTDSSDFWYAFGIHMGIWLLLSFLFLAADTVSNEYLSFTVLPLMILDLYTFMAWIPLLSMQIRRLHDTGHSAGQFILLWMLSLCLIGMVIRILLYVKDGEKCGNKWGAPTKELEKKRQGTPVRMAEENEFVDEYITKARLPEPKRWLQNMLVTFLFAFVVIVIQGILFYFVF